MIGLILGLFVTLLGLAIVGNAAFSDRAQFGSWVAIFGVFFMIIGAVELVMGML